jgi:lipopolysaccharide export LptBFGC system permease protein LptF
MFEGFQTNTIKDAYTKTISDMNELVKTMRTEFDRLDSLRTQRQDLINQRDNVDDSIKAQNIILKELNHIEETLNRQYLDQIESPRARATNIQDWSLIFFFISFAVFAIVISVAFIRMSTEKIRIGGFVIGISFTLGLLFFVLIRAFG